jgi:hypothetical protein
MITIVYCTRESKPEHKEHLIKTSGLHKHAEVIEIINNGESLTKCYNRGLKQAKNDIVVFCHDDITIETKQWGNKLIKQFKENEHIGIIGVAGSKFMNKTGRWWDDRKNMYGRVRHTHGGKSWLSSYSPDQGNNLEDVLNVDGVWFSVSKKRLKVNFDESVEGFHFYDVDFSFRNYLDGCGVAVTTKIRINHLSIGETNDEWEVNRVIFADKFKDILPLRVVDKFTGSRKINVLIPHISKGDNSLESIIELATKLSELDVSVGIVSDFNKKNLMASIRAKIKTFKLQEPPSFKIGDGKFAIQTKNGGVLSEPNKLYKVNQAEYDVIFTENSDLLNSYKSMYPECKFVDISSVEFIEMEKTINNYKELFIKTYNEQTTS